ncbi:hypothetical protein PTNB73_00946 [Pyrenophora teres f. teres]|nr:hypothetical protein HRS9139_02194 [Pyrenophora teres f. teres]KAE8850049.1 hypothetical protein PTNB85_00465 [Pyrenophora teres f. teres]KAE8851927.1 hypothetical protein HRS9122_02214 [Pyrenophora teres f. teres]KAE8870596.1 hypothetical protein PTNB29_00940 [Pyrenophora teres f. teres]KAE8874314.1 hypothetical protein PTNB73_00946 [Pyrenophora teres f. teres]
MSLEHDVVNAMAVTSTEESSDRPAKRQRTASSIEMLNPHTAPDTDTSPQTAQEARMHITKELSTNGLLSSHQRSVLETAISFVDRLSHTPTPNMMDRSTFDKSMHVSTDMSPREIFNVILGNEFKALGDSAARYHTVDHVPPAAVERIALALMEGTADEKTLNLYRVIIHFQAAVVLYASQLQGPKSAAVQKHIQQMEYNHFMAAFTALDNISFLTTPSLLLAQALVTGAIMMQIIGNPVGSWELTAHASRTIVALGYHQIDKTVAENDTEREIYTIVANCAYFDSVMSLLLLRPRSLPKLRVSVADLLRGQDSAMSLLEMIPVHDKILDLTLDSGAKRSSAMLKDEVALLRSQMHDVYKSMEKERQTHLSVSKQDTLIHWKGMEFKYYSTMTSVYRLSPTVTTNRAEREECLQCARKALECVKLIEQLGRRLDHFIEGYDPYLAWSLLSYPLCPFFVVFCNVVGTSDPRDFQLLQDVTDSISGLVTENRYVHRLHRLCATLLGLCKPLVNVPDVQEPVQQQAPLDMATMMPEPFAPVMTFNSGPDLLNGNNDATSMMPSSWNDDMMWQLFQSQPSLDWFNADILDPAWDPSLPL